jgi:hypothetical protein
MEMFGDDPAPGAENHCPKRPLGSSNIHRSLARINDHMESRDCSMPHSAPESGAGNPGWLLWGIGWARRGGDLRSGSRAGSGDPRPAPPFSQHEPPGFETSHRPRSNKVSRRGPFERTLSYCQPLCAMSRIRKAILGRSSSPIEHLWSLLCVADRCANRATSSSQSGGAEVPLNQPGGRPRIRPFWCSQRGLMAATKH